MGDGDKIENQEISVAEHPDKYVVSFRMNPEAFAAVSATIQGIGDRDEIRTPAPKRKTNWLSDAYAMNMGDVTIRTHAPISSVSAYAKILFVAGFALTPTEAMANTVWIEVMKEENGTKSLDALTDALESALLIANAKDALIPPTQEQAQQSGLQAYAKNHKIDLTSLSQEEQKRLAEHLVREEVFPGWKKTNTRNTKQTFPMRSRIMWQVRII